MADDNDAAARRKEARIEAQREREFYRYWEPVRQLSQVDPVQCNPADPAAFEAHTPRLSPDTALTAFCQLAALRFNAKRAMLFFFDTVSSYVLAEATQSLSLQDDARHECDDNLWLGYAVVPRGNSVCEHTVKMPLAPAEDSEIGSQIPIKGIPDLQGDAKFCGLPLVTAGPRCRFYAGVPIVTSKGINIGAFCVMDDVPRESIAEKDATFLRDMSTTVTTHLEIVRSKREQQRGMQMITGLGAFVQGNSDLRNWHHNAGKNGEKQARNGAVATLRSSRSSNSLRQTKGSVSYQPAPVPTLPAAPLGMAIDPVHRTETSPDASMQAVKPLEGLSRADSAPAESRSHSGSEGSRPTLSPQGSSQQVSSGPPSRHSSIVKDGQDGAQAQTVSTDIKSTYERAADLLREATEVHGIEFLDASIGTFGGLVENMGSHQDTDEASTTAHDTDTAETDASNVASSEQETQAPKQCQVLGSSMDPQCEQTHQRPQLGMTERFLKSLLRRYPHGMIWNFDEHGLASSEDESPTGDTSDGASGPSSRPNASSHLPKVTTVRDKKKRKRSRVEDAKLIQQHFPGVRSIGLHGLWDQSRDRWYAACFLWTYSPLRIFSVSSEMNYIAAFCDVIMAETRRLEIQRVDNAKSSVLASVSHELRSPLHGILGSAEVLRDQPIDDLSTSLVSQIESCGRTLLDIIDHLLDFSDINHFISRRGKHHSNSNDRRRVSGGSPQKSQMGGMMSLDVDIALDEITEEVVEAAVYSFSCSQPVGVTEHITTILDIDRPKHCNWRCSIAAGGWRRVLMNLVTNSLKYTKQGQVYIGLRSEPVKGLRKRENVVLTVADSGQGMSKAFLEEGLYKAFSQENTLVEGMGLGMSMVAKIVQAFGGSIEVQSDQIGGGTKVIVTVPIEKTRGKQPVDPEDAAMRARLLGVKVGVYGLSSTVGAPYGSTSHTAARPTLRSAVAKTLQQNGLEVVPVSTLDNSMVHSVAVTESDLALLLQGAQQNDSHYAQTAQRSAAPLIVICESVQSERTLRRQLPDALAGRPVEFVSQPCGPGRLHRAVAACLRRQDAADVGSARAQMPSSQDALESMGAQEVEGVMHDEGTTPIPFEPNAGSPRILSSSTVDPRELEVSPRTVPESPPAIDASQKIPAEPEQPTTAPTMPLPIRRATTPAFSTPTAQTSGLTLLLVDDNHINLSLLQTYARKNCHVALTATDGAQAVSTYKAAHIAVPPATPRVVVMDINMPVLNGFEATQQIRAYEQAHGLEAATIIALTGLGSADAQREAFSSGLDLFLTKPVSLKELGRVIDGLKSKENGA